LHHLHIVKDTPLESEYRTAPFPLLGLDEYVELVIDFLERLDPSIRIERFMGTSPHDQLVGPVWDTGRSGIRHRIESRMRDRNTWQGKLCTGGKPSKV
jgi:radical SAM superfamily enzyme